MSPIAQGNDTIEVLPLPLRQQPADGHEPLDPSALASTDSLAMDWGDAATVPAECAETADRYAHHGFHQQRVPLRRAQQEMGESPLEPETGADGVGRSIAEVNRRSFSMAGGNTVDLLNICWCRRLTPASETPEAALDNVKAAVYLAGQPGRQGATAPMLDPVDID